eukprot:TRINITY_DN7269_c0_g3_i2.p1 TRINITY_DN7269_c0_g3~~TRINITY_DN7269_c0_g3_i2.p1  ORF type:complete len:492 (+),score=150.56 TRINITY_DN7269_c0_g3_i2:122-1477(+)
MSTVSFSSTTVPAAQLEIQGAEWDCQVEYEFAVQCVMPPPPHPGRYTPNYRVEVVHPEQRSIDAMLKQQVAAKEYDWMPDIAPVIQGHCGRVVDYCHHPQRGVFLHVVELDHMPQGKNVILIEPTGLAPATWKGQLVAIGNPGARYNTNEHCWKSLFPTLEDKWADVLELCQGKTARIQAVISHPQKGQLGVQICICKFEPGDKYFMIDPSGLRDVKVLPAPQRPKPKPLGTGARGHGGHGGEGGWPRIPKTPRPGGGAVPQSVPKRSALPTALPTASPVAGGKGKGAPAGGGSWGTGAAAGGWGAAQQGAWGGSWGGAAGSWGAQGGSWGAGGGAGGAWGTGGAQWGGGQQQQQPNPQFQAQQWAQYAQQGQAAQAPAQQQQPQPQQQQAANNTEEQNRREAAEALAQGKLWSKVHDARTGCFYFRNNQTGQSLWTPPPGWDEATQNVVQ